MAIIDTIQITRRLDTNGKNTRKIKTANWKEQTPAAKQKSINSNKITKGEAKIFKYHSLRNSNNNKKIKLMNTSQLWNNVWYKILRFSSLDARAMYI